MNEFEQEMANDLYQDYQDRMAEDHVLREEEELRRKVREGYFRNTREAAVDMADAVFSKHGNYPAALIEVCHTLIMLGADRAIDELVAASMAGDTSPF